MKKKSDEERKKEVERIAKHIHPHDDEPDPTAHMGNYNFPQIDMQNHFTPFDDLIGRNSANSITFQGASNQDNPLFSNGMQ